MKKVYKYGTGQFIPEGAIYLTTKVETETKVISVADDVDTDLKEIRIKRNVLVWHYFLVEVENG